VKSLVGKRYLYCDKNPNGGSLAPLRLKKKKGGGERGAVFYVLFCRKSKETVMASVVRVPFGIITK